MHAKKIIENAVLASDNKLVKLELSIKSNESPEMKQTSN